MTLGKRTRDDGGSSSSTTTTTTTTTTTITDSNSADPTLWTVVNGKLKKPNSLLTRQTNQKRARKEKRS